MSKTCIEKIIVGNLITRLWFFTNSHDRMNCFPLLLSPFKIWFSNKANNPSPPFRNLLGCAHNNSPIQSKSYCKQCLPQKLLVVIQPIDTKNTYMIHQVGTKLCLTTPPRQLAKYCLTYLIRNMMAAMFIWLANISWWRRGY